MPGSVAGGTSLAFAPDGRLFVNEELGNVRVYTHNGSNWTLTNANFLANTPITTTNTGERGLLGIAFDSDYMTNRYVYFYYTATTPAVHNRIIRVTADAAGTNTVAASTLVMMDLPNLGATNHNGGALKFYNGQLYVGVGDNAVSSNAQSMTTVFGKMLRINRDGTIPSDNPFFSSTTGINQSIWAMGLRNPYTFAFRPGTNFMYINDVGQNAWEEINQGIAGANYGWPATEGRFNQGSFPTYTNPLVSYNHNDGALSYPTPGFTGFAITGGAFYNPTNFFFPASFDGDYFFADNVSSFIRRFDPSDGANGTTYAFATGASGPVDMVVGNDGSLYYLARGGSNVFQVRYNPGAIVDVDSVVIDDNTGQRSMVRSLTVHFSGTVTFAGAPTAAFSLVGPGGAVTVVPSAIDNSSGHSIVTLTFSGTGQGQGSLADGAYTLSVLGDQLRDNFGRYVDGDGNGVPRGDFVTNFNRLYGDSNGDTHVDIVDFVAFRGALGNGPSIFDNDGDGNTDLLDLLDFRAAMAMSP